MYKKIVFYNEFGNGDIFESREFVKAWMRLIPVDQYFYAHAKNPRILLDITNLQYTEMIPFMNPRYQLRDSDNHDTLFINTWIGITGHYLLPGIGCTVERLYDMHNDMLKVIGAGVLPGIPLNYIPEIEYSIYGLQAVNDFLYFHPEEKILIDNGIVNSMQAENFPFDTAIYKVAANHKDKCFIVTHGLPLETDNVFPTQYITKRMNFDLPEISYLSTFCSTLIGRNSGPHVFSQVKKNVMDENKKLLSFTYKPTGSSFVVNTPVSIRKYWSDATTTSDVVDIIERTLND